VDTLLPKEVVELLNLYIGSLIVSQLKPRTIVATVATSSGLNSHGVSQDFLRMERCAVLRRHTNIEIDFFPLISFAYIFMEKTTLHLCHHLKYINFPAAKRRRDDHFCCVFGRTTVSNIQNSHANFSYVTSKFSKLHVNYELV